MRDKILLLNGPNLNALGRREPEKYGFATLSSLEQDWQEWASGQGICLVHKQSQFEGELLQALHSAETENEIFCVVFNPGAFTHTSRALRDAIASLSIPVIEVHITNVAAREEWRRHSTVSEVCVGTISGLGVKGYILALEAALNLRAPSV